MILFRCQYFVIAALALAFSTLQAKPAGELGGDGHSGDIAKVLGVNLDDTQVNAKIKAITSGFARKIDGKEDASELLRKIREISPDFTWSKYTHRIFFHWGFNRNPRNASALRNQIELATEDAGAREKIWTLIESEQGKRNKEMFDIIQKNLKASSGVAALTRAEVNAIASIVYDTHIIGDYIEGKEIPSQALFPLPDLLADIINATRNLGCADAKLLSSFKRNINDAQAKGADDKARARLILDVMIAEIPSMINNSDRVRKALRGK